MNQFRDLSDSDVNKLLSDLLHNGEKITSEHLNLAVLRRLFKIAAKIILSGVISEQIGQHIANIMQSPLEIDESFHVLLAALAIKNIHLKEVLNSVPFVSDQNKHFLLPILAYHLINYDDLPNLNYEYNFFIDKDILQNAYEKRDTDCLAYQFVEYLLNYHLSKLKPKLRLFNANMESINIPMIPRRVTELTRAISSYTKKIDQPMFSRIVGELQHYLSKDVVPVCDDLSATAASLKLFINSIPNSIHAFTSLASYFDGDISEQAQKYVISSIDEKYSNRLQASLAHVITLSYIAGISRLPNSKELLEKFKVIANSTKDNFPDKLNGYNDIVVQPLQRYKSVFDNSSQVAQVITNACKEIRNIVVLGEYMLLDAVIRDEAAQIAADYKYYPVKYANILKEFKTAENAKKNVANRRELLEHLNVMATDFLNAVKTCPGALIGIDIENSQKPNDWKWPDLPFSLPETPAEVHKMLCDRQDLIMKACLLSQFENAPKCRHENCSEFADRVCPKCRKLVLCQTHCEDGEVCPICKNKISVV